MLARLDTRISAVVAWHLDKFEPPGQSLEPDRLVEFSTAPESSVLESAALRRQRSEVRIPSGAPI